MRNPIALLFTFLFVLSCRQQNCEINPDIAKVNVNLDFERLEKPFYEIKNENELQTLLKNNPTFTNIYLARQEFAGEEDLNGTLIGLIREPNLQRFVKETDAYYSDMTKVQQDLTNGFKHLKYYYPDFSMPQVKTFNSGLLGPDLFLTDSLVVLGIDYFAGPKASYRPQQPDYILTRYARENMVPALFTMISARYNKTDARNNTMLAEMINYGKSYYFTQRMLPCAPDSAIIGYTDQQIADVNYNEGKIWAHFVQKSLLYETSHFKVNKYTGERPNVPEISKRCPGRIATWVGWQIVKKYMQENPEVTLPQLMAEPDAQKIFTQSRYKPKPR